MHQSVAKSISKSLPMLPVDALLRPRAIALVGISAKGGAGANILRSGERLRDGPDIGACHAKTHTNEHQQAD